MTDPDHIVIFGIVLLKREIESNSTTTKNISEIVFIIILAIQILGKSLRYAMSINHRTAAQKQRNINLDIEKQKAQKIPDSPSNF